MWVVCVAAQHGHREIGRKGFAKKYACDLYLKSMLTPDAYVRELCSCSFWAMLGTCPAAPCLLCLPVKSGRQQSCVCRQGVGGACVPTCSKTTTMSLLVELCSGTFMHQLPPFPPPTPPGRREMSRVWQDSLSCTVILRSTIRGPQDSWLFSDSVLRDFLFHNIQFSPRIYVLWRLQSCRLPCWCRDKLQCCLLRVLNSQT